MKPVCVITGGGSGMGRATAKLVCEAGYHVILVGRTAAKLESAVAELAKVGHEAEAFSCDLADRSACEKLAQHAVECGQVKALHKFTPVAQPVCHLFFIVSHCVSHLLPRNFCTL